MQQILVDMNNYGSQAASGMRVPKPRMTTTFMMDVCEKLSYYLVMLCHFKIALIFKGAKFQKLNLFKYN